MMNWQEWIVGGSVLTVIGWAVAAVRLHYSATGRIEKLEEAMATLAQAQAKTENSQREHHENRCIHRDPERDGERWKELVAKLDGYQAEATRRFERLENLIIHGPLGED